MKDDALSWPTAAPVRRPEPLVHHVVDCVSLNSINTHVIQAVRARGPLAFPVGVINETNIDEWHAFSSRQGMLYPLMYDDVVMCLGWKHDTSMYDDTVKPLMQPNGKFAIMTNAYESVNVPGLHFVGNLGHGKDFKRSAGGFIHGFRYTARVLERLLGWRYHGDDWPGKTVFAVNDQGLRHLEETLFERIANADGNYQMVASLGKADLGKYENINIFHVGLRYHPSKEAVKLNYRLVQIGQSNELASAGPPEKLVSLQPI